MLSTFCGVLTLQVGAAILAAVFLTLAGVIIAANLFEYHSNVIGGWFPYSLILLIIFVILLCIAAALMFGSSYSESRTLAIFATVVIIILFCFWLVLCCFSLLSYQEHVNGICIGIMNSRCPESFWIANVRYRIYQLFPNELRPPTPPPTQPPPNTEPSTEPPETHPHRRRRKRLDGAATESGIFKRTGDRVHEQFFNELSNIERDRKTTEGYRYLDDQPDSDIDQALQLAIVNRKNIDVFVYANSNFHRERREDTTPQKKNDPKNKDVKDDNKLGDEKGDQPGHDKDDPKKENKKKDPEIQPSRYVFGSALLGAIILFIINIIFLLFSALVMYSWAQELDWADYYYEDDPVVVVEDY